jgi:hypothetical protein
VAKGHLEVPRGCPWPWATVKFYTFYFFLSFTCIWPLPCPPFYVFLSFTLYLAPALPALLFFLIFYSLFGPCPARPFIFPYLLLFIWPLPFPHGPAPCPARQTDRRTLPCPLPRPALSGRPFFRIPGPVFRIPFSESDCPGRFHHVN